MKAMQVVFVGTFLTAATPSLAESSLTSDILRVEEDRFTGAMVISSPQPTSPAGLRDLKVAVLASLSRKDARTDVNLIIRRASDAWRYLSCSHTYWLVDGQRLELPQPRHKGDVGTGYVLEFLYIVSVPEAAFRQMAEASTVEYKVCNDEAALSSKEMAEIRELWRMLPLAKAEMGLTN